MRLPCLIDRGHSVHIVSQIEGNIFRQFFNNLSLKRQTSDLPEPDVIIADELNHGSLWFSGISSLRQKTVCVALVHHLRCLEKLSKTDLIFTKKRERIFLNAMDAFILAEVLIIPYAALLLHLRVNLL